MREKELECKLVKAVRDSGGLDLKFVSPNMDGVPDRLLLFPGGRAAFAEVKAPGQKPRLLQVHRMEQLRELGFRVYVVDSEEKIEVSDTLSAWKNLSPVSLITVSFVLPLSVTMRVSSDISPHTFRNRYRIRN